MRLNSSRRGRSVRRLAIVASVALVAGEYGVSVPTTAAASDNTLASWHLSSSWSEPNGDKAGTRRVGGPINSRNVDRLGVAWTVPIVADPTLWPGTYATTPVVNNGVVYTQDLSSNVYAIDLRTGRQLWTTMFNAPTPGPTGVAVAEGKVFGADGKDAFALNARTGQLLWRKRLINNEFEGIDMAPGVNNGTVYISTVPGNAQHFLASLGQGVLWALDADTGRTKWTFDTVPKDLWGHPEINAGGGVWYPPSFDREGNVYVEVANPEPFVGTTEFPWGSSRPGPNLYTNSMVKLNPRNGKVIWYNQVLPHDIYDWDFQNSPVITNAGHRPVVIGSGKMGFVYSFDQRTGQMLWKTPVGRHNGHDDDNLYAMRGEWDKLSAMPYTVYPGALGGVISPAAVDNDTVYVAVNMTGATWATQEPPPIIDFNETGGEFVAIDLITGRIKWRQPLATSAFGGATVANDVVFTTSFDGLIHAFNTRTGQLVWQDQLPSSTNAPVAIHGQYVLAAGGWPQAPGQRAEIVAYKLGGGR